MGGFVTEMQELIEEIMHHLFCYDLFSTRILKHMPSGYIAEIPPSMVVCSFLRKLRTVGSVDHCLPVSIIADIRTIPLRKQQHKFGG